MLVVFNDIMKALSFQCVPLLKRTLVLNRLSFGGILSLDFQPISSPITNWFSSFAYCKLKTKKGKRVGKFFLCIKHT